VSALRIAYVLGTTAGGTGRHAAMLAAGCSRRGLTVRTFGPAAIRQLLQPGSFSFVPIEIADRPRPARDAAAILRLRRLLASFQPDVVHSHGLRAGAIAALALTPAPRRGPALLVTVHNAPAAGAAAGTVYQLLERVVARRADAVLAVSPDLTARMQRRGARDVALAIVPAPRPAPPSAAETAKALAGIGAGGAPVVLAVGRLAEQKGFAGLLDAAAGWQDRDPRPLLVIAGSGPGGGAGGGPRPPPPASRRPAIPPPTRPGSSPWPDPRRSGRCCCRRGRRGSAPTCSIWSPPGASRCAPTRCSTCNTIQR
jgi:glycosyltransferase involved in cell wall biosynthesis